MSRGSFVYRPISTVGGAGITVATGSGTLYGGFFLNGSAGGETLTIKNGATIIAITSAGANVFISVVLPSPIALSQIVATCSGTGFYSVFVAK
ncbi:hypothetical protein KKH13_04850 [Patescibacteria group bacterium]|nr:hypothetical protein [Patescibacteria group bacterium]